MFTCSSSIMSNERYVRWANFIFSCQITILESLGNFISYLRNLIVAELHLIVTFNESIFHIVLMGTKKKMIWINACGVITFVKYMHFAWVNFIGKLKRESVSKVNFFMKIYSSVSIEPSIPRPKPTSVGFFNIFPKSIFEWDTIISPAVFTHKMFEGVLAYV